MPVIVEKINLTVFEAVQASGIGRTTLFALIKSGELESVKIGRRRYIPVEALRDYLNRLRAEQNSGVAIHKTPAVAIDEITDASLPVLRRVCPSTVGRQPSCREGEQVTGGKGAA